MSESDASTETHRVFISYGRGSKADSIAQAIASHLLRCETEVFLDRKMQPGERWEEVIPQSLAQSDHMIVVLSPDALDSRWIARELQIADSRRKECGLPYILPILVDLEPPLRPPLGVYLNELQPLVWGEGDDLEQLYERVEAALESLGSRGGVKGAVANADKIVYRRWARKNNGTIDLVGIGGGDLWLEMDSVYVPLQIRRRSRLVDVTTYRNSVKRKVLEASSSEVDLLAIFQDLGSEPAHAVIFGNPGAGKTTSFRKLLNHCLSEGPESLGLPEGMVPILLHLRRFRHEDLAQGFDLFIERELSELSAGHLPTGLGLRQWADLPILLLLDGLDEIAERELRVAFCKYLENLVAVRESDRLWIAVSSRYAGYGGDVYLRRFRHFDIAPLGPSQTEEMVRRYFHAAHEQLASDGDDRELLHRDAEADSARLIEALNGSDYGSQQLKVNIGTPILLTLLCLVVLRGGDMPRRRVEFYRQCLEMLLSRWTRTRDAAAPVTVEQAFQILRRLAFWMHGEGRRKDVSKAEFIHFVQRELEFMNLPLPLQSDLPFRLLDWLHRGTGVLEEFAPHNYGFMHLGIQEYLTALEIASQGVDHSLPNILDLDNEWWDEVTRLIVGLPDRKVFTPVIRELVRRNLLITDPAFIRDCLEEAVEVDLEPFLELLGDGDRDEVIAVLRLLRGFTNPRLLSAARALIAHADEEIVAHAEQLLDEATHYETESGTGAHDLFLAFDRADREAVKELETDLEGAGIRLLSGEGEVWQESLETILADSRGAAVALGDSGHAPWQSPAVLACLQSFARRKLPVIVAHLKLSVPRPDLPPALGAHCVELYGEKREAGIRRIRQILEEPIEGAAKAVATSPTKSRPFTEPRTGIRFVWIPGGEFEMGDEEVALADPKHRVRVSPFWLGEVPVTNEQYSVFLETTRYKEPKFWRVRHFSDPRRPVVGTSWHDGTAYANWLAQELALEVCLPSEAQWEFAARGTDGRCYPWGDDAPDSSKACFQQDEVRGRPTIVGSYPNARGPFGTLDQAGNVWEWCLDRFHKEFYKQCSAVDPVCEAKSLFRLIRGGGWESDPVTLHSAYRFRLWPDSRSKFCGFRLAIVP